MAALNDALSRCDVETAVYSTIKKLGYSSVKPQQMMIREFINRRDTFVVLPTTLIIAFQLIIA